MRTRPSTTFRPVLWGVVALCLLVAVPAASAPLVGETVSIREPDGTFVDVVVWGDEFYAVGETKDGFTLTRDPGTGLLCYARLSDDGRVLVSTGVPAREAPPDGLVRHARIDRAAAREQALAARGDFERRAHDGPLAPRLAADRGPSTGQVEGIVLIIDFSDDAGTIPPGTVFSYCNTPGYTGYGNNGSVYDYFYDVSEGLLKYTNHVQTQYYHAIHTKAYYCDNTVPYGQRARELIIEALSAMEAGGFDFSQYDADDNGVIDALNCFYAGERWNSWAEGLWPHSWTVSFCADGVCTYRYQITNMGSGLTLGTFCHENGHMLMGWPDLYDYDYDSSGAGVFCLMGYGGFALNPAEPCAYMKLTAGWADVTVVTEAADDLVVPDDGNAVFKFDHPTLANEYYLIENRQRTARDANLPDDGLAIWHIDTQGDNSNQQQTPELHYLVTLVQADGRWDLENDANAGDGTDLYAAPVYTQCTPESDPNTDWWSGGESGLAFTGIGASGATMTFDFLDAPPARPAGLGAEARELSIELDWNSVNAADLDHYSIERDTTALFGGGTITTAASDTTLVVYPLEPGREYYFRVFAVDLGGHTSAPSDTVSAVPTLDIAPSAPTGLAALGGGGVVELVWDGSPEIDVVAYAVVRDSTLAFAAPETLGLPAGSPYIDATCPLNRAYWYRVVAKDQGGALSDPSAPAAGIAVSGRAWYVDASYGGLEFGTYAQPYRSISAAVGHSASGDVVIVNPGVYADPVDLRDGVSLIGMRGAGSTTVSGGMIATGIGRSAVLKGLRADGEGVLAIVLDCSLSDLVIEDCEFMGATTAGVSCHDGGSPLIRRNLFTANLRGIRCVDSGPLVVSNTFVANTSSDIANFGNPGPVIGGSLAAANDFLEPGTRAIANYDSVVVSAEHNHWGADCVDPAWFTGLVDYLPWTDETHTLAYTECWSAVPETPAPETPYMSRSYPNPSNPRTAIAFGLPEPGGAVCLRVYGASGRLVRTLVNELLSAGRHVAEWDGKDTAGADVPSGVYFFRLEAPGITSQAKVTILR